MLTILVRCQASTTKHMGRLIAHNPPWREITESTYSNLNRCVDSLEAEMVRRLYITHFASVRLSEVCLRAHVAVLCSRENRSVVTRLCTPRFCFSMRKQAPGSVLRHGPIPEPGLFTGPYTPCSSP